MLADFLPHRFPDRFTRHGNLMHNHAQNDTLNLAEPGRNALELASLMIQVQHPAFFPLITEDLNSVGPDIYRTRGRASREERIGIR